MLQIAELAAADGLTGSYTAARPSARPLLNPVHYGAPRGTPNLEGFLFPATYDMKAGAPVSRLVSEQLIAFREHFGAERDPPRARATRHALPAADGRLDGRARGAAAGRQAEDRGRHLQPPAHWACRWGSTRRSTTRSSWQKGIATYTRELTEAQLHIDSPYNTRTARGLPPTPISNPGMASIEAAAHPAHVPYLYYVAGADGCGEQVFSTHAPPSSKRTRGLRCGGQEERRQAAGVQEEVMHRLGVLGWPVAHSRSPAMHNAALAALGMEDWRYQRLPVPAELFAETTRALARGGLSSGRT